MCFSCDSLLCCLTVLKTMCKYVLPVLLFFKCNIYIYISCIGTKFKESNSPQVIITAPSPHSFPTPQMELFLAPLAVSGINLTFLNHRLIWEVSIQRGGPGTEPWDLLSPHWDNLSTLSQRHSEIMSQQLSGRPSASQMDTKLSLSPEVTAPF